MSIGAVLDLLRLDFPDVTISKIRFLEAEGLVTPERSPSGYRRFTAYDCARLRFILTAQRDQYLPLKVIKSQLDSQPDGELPVAPYPAPRLVPVTEGVMTRNWNVSLPETFGPGMTNADEPESDTEAFEAGDTSWNVAPPSSSANAAGSSTTAPRLRFMRFR